MCILLNTILPVTWHCVKSVHIWRSSGPHFPTFGLNTESSIFSANVVYCRPQKSQIRTLSPWKKRSVTLSCIILKILPNIMYERIKQIESQISSWVLTEHQWPEVVIDIYQPRFGLSLLVQCQGYPLQCFQLFHLSQILYSTQNFHCASSIINLISEHLRVEIILH